MLYKSVNVAFVIGLLVSVITTAFLTLVPNTPIFAYIVTFVLSFGATFVATYFSLEFLVFDEIQTIIKQLDKLRKKDVTKLKKTVTNSSNPLKELKQGITEMASINQQEIDELKKLANFRREFLADVSHELKTPIFSAQGFIHTLLDGAINDENVRDKFLQKAANTLDDMDVLVHDLISISQIESGDLKMHYEPTDLINLCKEVYYKYEEKALKKNVTLNFEKKSNNPSLVLADPKWLRQVISNLVENAINYGKEKGTVTIKFSETKGKVIILVKDDGQGIAPEHQKRIFERFYRVEKSRNKEKGGSGLGLSIVKHIIEAHDSKIKLESEEGKGTTFSFALKKAENFKDED
jgi:two-component system, OmpR family, phosphate regulon sensor histidine kinase PhoR